MAHGNVHYLRLTADTAKAKTFYYNVFNWKFGASFVWDGRTYVPWDGGDGPNGDMVNPVGTEPIDWLPFIQVNDIAASIILAKKEGASVIQEATAWKDGSKYAILKDPAGARIGLWQLPA